MEFRHSLRRVFLVRTAAHIALNVLREDLRESLGRSECHAADAKFGRFIIRDNYAREVICALEVLFVGVRHGFPEHTSKGGFILLLVHDGADDALAYSLREFFDRVIIRDRHRLPMPFRQFEDRAVPVASTHALSCACVVAHLAKSIFLMGSQSLHRPFCVKTRIHFQPIVNSPEVAEIKVEFFLSGHSPVHLAVVQHDAVIGNLPQLWERNNRESKTYMGGSRENSGKNLISRPSCRKKNTHYVRP